MIVRWLGAFRGHEYTLFESLKFEATRPTSDEVAAEKFAGNSHIGDAAPVGLLIKNSAILKQFSGDCFSLYNENGSLYKTRNPRKAGSEHKEVFANALYTAIVVCGDGLHRLTQQDKKSIKLASKVFNLPVFKLINGRLLPITGSIS